MYKGYCGRYGEIMNQEDINPADWCFIPLDIGLLFCLFMLLSVCLCYDLFVCVTICFAEKQVKKKAKAEMLPKIRQKSGTPYV